MIKNHFILTILACSLVSVYSSGLCLNRQTECKGSYDSNYNYRIGCSLVECSGNYGFKCGNEYCSSDQSFCFYYQNYKLVIDSNRKEKKSRYHKKLISSIHKCPPRKYEFKLDDVCLNGAGCTEKKLVQLRFNKMVLHKEIECPCMDTYNYHCNLGFCTINKEACDQFNQLRLLDSSITQVLDIKPCGNGNTTITRNFI